MVFVFLLYLLFYLVLSYTYLQLCWLIVSNNNMDEILKIMDDLAHFEKNERKGKTLQKASVFSVFFNVRAKAH
jgi:hypothetical protein